MGWRGTRGRLATTRLVGHGSWRWDGPARGRYARRPSQSRSRGARAALGVSTVGRVRGRNGGAGDPPCVASSGRIRSRICLLSGYHSRASATPANTRSDCKYGARSRRFLAGSTNERILFKRTRHISTQFRRRPSLVVGFVGSSAHGRVRETLSRGSRRARRRRDPTPPTPNRRRDSHRHRRGPLQGRPPAASSLKTKSRKQGSMTMAP